MMKLMTALAAMSMVAIPAAAQERVEVRIQVADLDLDTHEGRHGLQERAAKAARAACGSRSAADRKSAAVIEQCRADIVAKALNKANRLTLASR